MAAALIIIFFNHTHALFNGVDQEDIYDVKEDYLKGKYRNARDDIKDIIEDLKKKDNKSRLLGEAYFTHALIRQKTGYHKNAHQLLKRYKRFYNKHFSKHTYAYCQCLLNETTFYEITGQYLKIDSIAETGLENCRNQDIINRFKAKQFKVLANQGYFNKAEKLFNQIKPYFEKKIKNQEAPGSNGQTRELPDYALTWTKMRFTDIYTDYANLFVSQGLYDKGKQELLKVENWYKDHLKNRHPVSNKVYNSLGRLETIKGNLKEAAHYYEDAISNKLKNYAVDYIVSMEKLIALEYKRGRRGMAKRKQDNLSEIINEEFGKNSSIYIYFYLIRAHETRSNNKIYHAEDHIYNALKQDKILPANHPLRKRLLYEKYKIEESTGQTVRAYNIETAYEHFRQYLSIQKKLIGKHAPLYHRDLMKFAGYLIRHSHQFDTIRNIYEQSFDKVYTQHFKSTHADYINFLDNYTVFLQLTENYEKAAKNIEKTLKMTEKVHGKTSKAYTYQKERKGELFMQRGQYKKAKETFDDVHHKLLASDIPKNKKYLNSLKLKAENEMNLSLYNQAEKSLSKARNIAEQLRNEQKLFIKSLDPYFGALYIKTNRFKKAQPLLEADWLAKKRRYNKISRHKLKTMNTLAELYVLIGNFNEARQLIRQSIEINQKIFGKNSLKYAAALQLRYKNEKSIGDYENAKSNAAKVLSIQKNKFDKQHVMVGNTMADLAIIMYLKNEDADKVERYLHQSAQIVKMNVGNKHPQYAESLKNLARFYIPNNELKLAKNQLDQALEILKKGNSFFTSIFKKSKKNLQIGEINVLEGDIAMKQNKLEEAYDQYQEAKNLYKAFLDKSHPDYVSILSKIAKYHYASGNHEACLAILENTMKNYVNYIDNYFPSLTEREKLKFWSTMKPDFEFFNNVALSFADKNPQILNEVYDYTLITKSLLLKASKKIRKRILNSGDEKLISKFNEYLEKKELEASLLSMSEEEIQEENINPNKLRKDIKQLEKELSEKSEYWASVYKDHDITWRDIRDNLNANEVGIEMLRIRYYNHGFTDSVFYAAMIIKPDARKHPELVILPRGNKMENKNLVYYRNMIKYSSKESRSYKLYFKPIAEKIDSGKTILFSPDGVYNQINLETMMNADGEYMIDNYNIVLINNTGAIAKRKQEKKNYAYRPSARIFANPAFYPYKKSENANQQQRNHENTIPSLPGAEKEAKIISNLLNNEKWKVTLHTDTAATEEKLKKAKDIKVLHIATHGFFKESHQRKQNEYFNDKFDNPMLRSGLLLSNAGPILENDNVMNYNIQEGVLTAYEALNLNLKDAELVVLSACETGKGEVQVGEGVYGLQRAFLVAGSESLFMSLFKVSDKVTQQLMKKFYELWLAGNDLRKSFVQAKRAIKKEYPEPINWGAFIMVGI